MLYRPAYHGNWNDLSFATRALKDKFPTPAVPLTTVLPNRQAFVPDPAQIHKWTLSNKIKSFCNWQNFNLMLRFLARLPSLRERTIFFFHGGSNPLSGVPHRYVMGSPLRFMVFLLQNFQKGSGPTQPSIQWLPSSLPGGKAARTWSEPLISI
jgi:hypothetical protein